MSDIPTILVADDSRSVRVHVKQRLVEAGFNVVLAADGREAISHIANEQLDAAILDINMPELDGYAVCQQLDYIGSRMPVIFMTGVEANAVKLLGDRMGAYLPKPVGGELLVKTLRDVLQVKA